MYVLPVKGMMSLCEYSMCTQQQFMYREMCMHACCTSMCYVQSMAYHMSKNSGTANEGYFRQEREHLQHMIGEIPYWKLVSCCNSPYLSDWGTPGVKNGGCIGTGARNTSRMWCSSMSMLDTSFSVAGRNGVN